MVIDFGNIRKQIRAKIEECIKEHNEITVEDKFLIISYLMKRYSKEGIHESELYSMLAEEIGKRNGCVQIDQEIDVLPDWISKETIKKMDIIGKMIFVELVLKGKTIKDFDVKKYFSGINPIKSEMKKRLLEYKSIIGELESSNSEYKEIISMINYIINFDDEELSKNEICIRGRLGGDLECSEDDFNIIKDYKLDGEVYPTIFLLNRVGATFPTIKGPEMINKAYDTYKKSINSLIQNFCMLENFRSSLREI